MLVAKRLGVREAEVHDSIILVEAAALGCALLTSSDDDLQSIDGEKLALELARFDLIASVIATPREIIKKFFRQPSNHLGREGSWSAVAFYRFSQRARSLFVTSTYSRTMSDVTQLLSAMDGGDPKAATQLLPLADIGNQRTAFGGFRRAHLRFFGSAEFIPQERPHRETRP
jgi:hypothetical protein